jgi:Uncharacterized protein conserved in bacteria
MKKALAALALSLAFAVPAFAADEIAPERLALAKQVMELNGSSAAYSDYGKNLDRMVDQLLQSMPGADDATVADIKKIAVEEFNAYRPTLIDGIVKVYAKHFTEKDLKALIAFYKSDAGKHFSAEIPAVSQECMDLSTPFMTRFLDRIRQYIAAKIAAEAAKAPPEGSKEPPQDKSKTK